MKFHLKQLEKWHQFVENRDTRILDALFAENIKFHSPFVWKPKYGKPTTIAIISTVTEVFEDFRYVREIIDEENWALEFEAQIGKLDLRGVDLIKLDANGQIEDFEVMIRPANALQKVGEEMTKKLSEKGFI